jgi:tetratricopeptide (TPR) repeat protein
MKKLIAIIAVFGTCACNWSHPKSKREFLESKAFWYYDHDVYSKAISYLDSLIILDSTKGEYFFKRAYSYDKLNDIRSVDDYKKAIKLNYRVADVYQNLALDAMLFDKDSLALIFFSKAVTVDPSKTAEITPLIKVCQSEIEMKKTDAYKEFKAREKMLLQKPTPIKVN